MIEIYKGRKKNVSFRHTFNFIDAVLADLEMQLPKERQQIEEAYNQGKIKWKKPISCHLYPVRLMEYSEFTAVNYHKWPICDDACVLGIELQVPVY